MAKTKQKKNYLHRVVSVCVFVVHVICSICIVYSYLVKPKAYSVIPMNVFFFFFGDVKHLMDLQYNSINYVYKAQDYPEGNVV